MSASFPTADRRNARRAHLRDGRPAADHGAARDVDSGAVDDGVRLRGGDGGTTWVPGAAYVSWSCAPCGAECSGKF